MWIRRALDFYLKDRPRSDVHASRNSWSKSRTFPVRKQTFRRCELCYLFLQGVVAFKKALYSVIVLLQTLQFSDLLSEEDDVG